ncbi:MAG: FMN-binding protein [Clostridia bacterium]|nr:FMN-binding protein [Clostridia bacterium]
MANEILNNELTEIKETEIPEKVPTETVQLDEEFIELEIAELNEGTVDIEEEENRPEPAKPTGPASTGYSIRMVVVLTAICAFVALLLSVVNNLTKDVIAENNIKARDAAILRVFPEGDLVEMHGGDGIVKTEMDTETVSGKVYRIYKGGTFIGYCVNVTPDGYENPISMMVGINTENTVVGITIVEIKETAGVGSKTNSEGFLSQFLNKSGPFAVGESIDGIAGATISSKAVTKGVNTALALVQKLSDTPIPVPQPSETEPVETDSPETEPPETDPVETESVETDLTETEPEETEPEETEPMETESEENEPVETQPVVTWPTETQPEVTWPEETEPPETEPADTEPIETETEAEETDSAETETESTETEFETEEWDNWITEPFETQPPEDETEAEEEETEKKPSRPNYVRK